VSFLKKEWLKELNSIRNKLVEVRKSFVSILNLLINDRDFSYIEKQKGLFCLLNLSEEQIMELIKKYGIYLPLNGRINIAGLNKQNIEYISESIKKVLIK